MDDPRQTPLSTILQISVPRLNGALVPMVTPAYQQLRLLSGLSMYLHRTLDVVGRVALRAEAVANRTGNPEDKALAASMLGKAY